jgi:hypothetical protein
MKPPRMLAGHTARERRWAYTVLGYVLAGIGCFGLLLVLWAAASAYLAGERSVGMLLIFLGGGSAGLATAGAYLIEPLLTRDLIHELRNLLPFLPDVTPEQRTPKGLTTEDEPDPRPRPPT